MMNFHDSGKRGIGKSAVLGFYFLKLFSVSLIVH